MAVVLNSRLYKARVLHHRLEPKKHSFHYDIFMFYLDLDEVPAIAKKLRWFGHNKFNLFNFRDKDHLQLPREAPDTTKTVRQHITDYLSSNGVNIGTGRIMLLTNLCTLGYQFNPVSFYFCYNEQGGLVCSVVEVCNTFREMKPYFLGGDTQTGTHFHLNTAKHFYVSPFIDMDTNFDFNLDEPGEKLHLRIDDFTADGSRFFISTLSGTEAPLTDTNLLKFFFSFPLITLQVMGLIHWQAMKLWFKKLPFHKKETFKHLQKDVYRPYPVK